MLKELDAQGCPSTSSGILAIGLNQWMKEGLIRNFDRGSKF